MNIRIASSAILFLSPPKAEFAIISVKPSGGVGASCLRVRARVPLCISRLSSSLGHQVGLQFGRLSGPAWLVGVAERIRDLRHRGTTRPAGRSRSLPGDGAVLV